MDISKRRARSIEQGLVERGVDPKRLVSRGYGSEVPLVSSKHPDALTINRRVELHILEPAAPPSAEP